MPLKQGQLAKIVNSPNAWANGRTVTITGVGPYLTTHGIAQYICSLGLYQTPDMFGIDDQNLLPLEDDKATWASVEVVSGWNPLG